jgi:methylenetetrahydrofolate reductase (NADPH)
MCSLAACKILREEGIDAVMQMVCRDRNRIAAQSDILGAASLGISNLLCLSGDHQTFGDHPQAKNVFDVDSIQLVKIATEMRDAAKFSGGKDVDGPPEMFIGAAVNPFADPFKIQVPRLAKKVAAGAQFIQTQCVFNLEKFEEFMKGVRDRGLHEKTYILAGITPLKSATMAEYIATKVAGMDVPEAVINRLKGVEKKKQKQEGIKIAVETIQQLKEQITREGLEAAMKELRKVEELLRSLIEALSKSATALPDEFMNNPEIAGLDFQDLFKDLEEMARKLSAGDVEGALEAAQRLLQTLSEMLASLGRARAQAGLSPFDRLQGEMSRQAGELEKILREQRQIFNETEGVERQIRQQSVEETGRRLARQGPRLKEILGKLKSSLEPEQQDWIDELGKALRKGDVEELSKMAETLERNLFGKASEIDESLEALRTLRRTLRPKASDLLTPFQKERLGQLSSRQGDLKERTNRLKERLEALAQLFPGMDTEILNDLREAATFMAEASDKLGERNPSGAIPPEQEAIRRLAKSQQAMEQMAQQMAMRMQAARYGYPWAYDPRAGWYYGPWIPMPTLPQPEFNRPRERGMTGIDREEFETPSKDAYKVPKRLREKVLDALKEGVPPEYKRDVERYFRGLTK